MYVEVIKFSLSYLRELNSVGMDIAYLYSGVRI